MKNSDPEDFERELKRRRSNRNVILALLLLGLAALMYVVTLVKLSRQGATEELAAAVEKDMGNQ